MNLFEYAKQLGYNGAEDLFELHQWLFEQGVLCLVSSVNETAGSIDYHVKIYPKYHKDGSENLHYIEKIVFTDNYKGAFEEALYEGLDCLKYYRTASAEAFEHISWEAPEWVTPDKF